MGFLASSAAAFKLLKFIVAAAFAHAAAFVNLSCAYFTSESLL